MSEGLRDQRPIVEVRGVSKSYRSGRESIPALTEVDLVMHSGEFVSIVGPSGCGKSTLMKIAAGLTPASSGRVSVLGNEVTGPVIDLGVVFQQHLLLPWRTILQNVLLQMEIRGRSDAAAKDRAVTLLESVGLGDFVDRFPDELSGGMKQRASIVRAMVHDPDLILMDEPFGALDAMTRDQMTLDFHALSRNEGKTVLFVTHSIDEAVFLSDRVVVMSPRPGGIDSVITIDLPRHRTLELRDEHSFTAYAKQIRALFQGMGILRERQEA